MVFYYILSSKNKERSTFFHAQKMNIIYTNFARMPEKSGKHKKQWQEKSALLAAKSKN